MFLREYAAVYVARRDGSPGYLDQLRWTIAALEKHANRSLHLADLDESLINSYLIATCDSLAPQTRRSRRNAIIRLWRHAAADPLLF